MNRKLVGYLLGAIMMIEAACMVPSLVIALIYQDEDVWALGKSILLLAAIGAPMRFGIHPKERNLRAQLFRHRFARSFVFFIHIVTESGAGTSKATAMRVGLSSASILKNIFIKPYTAFVNVPSLVVRSGIA